MTSWFVVHTRANGEAKAKYHLERQGFATYVPRYLKLRKHARRSERVPAPLFPRYLFVAFDPLITRWRAIHSTVGVSHLVASGDQPTPVPGAIMEALRAGEDASGFFQVDERPQFVAGDVVRVVAGAFADAVGRFHSMSDTDRIVVLLEFLGRPVRVRLPIEAVAVGA